MKYLFGIVSTLLVLFSVAGRCDPSKVVWSQHPEVATFSLSLSDNALRVDVKNATNSRKRLVIVRTDTYVQPYYINEQGALVAIGVAPHNNGFQNEEVEGPNAVDLPANGKFSSTIKLSPEELAQIEAHGVVCKICVYDPATDRRVYVQSPAEKLTPTSAPASP